jgi:replicative DNA helicase
MNNESLYTEDGEKAVIGSVLLNPDSYLNVAEFLQPEDFFFLPHNYIWAAIQKMERDNIAIDSVTLSHQLKDMGKLKEIGGSAYLTKLISETPTSRHAEVYGHMVKRIALRRQLLQAADTIKVLAMDTTIPVEGVFELAEKEIFKVTNYGMEVKPTDIFSLTNQFQDKLEATIEARNKGVKSGIPTGFPSIDGIIGGAYKTEVTVWAAPPKVGKSTMNLNLIRNRAKAGYKIVLFITEMLSEDVLRKFTALEAGIPVQALKDGNLNPKQFSACFEAATRISKWNVDIIDEYRRLTPLDIRRKLRKLSRSQPIGYIAVDGLWMMNSENQFRQRNEEITDIMISLVNIAKDFNIPIDVVHQLSRAAEGRQDKIPRNSDLSGSTGVEQNAYNLIFLYRENFYDDNGSDITKVIVSANRTGGRTGTANLEFDTQSERYSEIKPKGFSHKIVPQLPLDDAQKDRKDIYQ